MNCNNCKYITQCRHTLRFPTVDGCRSGVPSNHCPKCGSEHLAIFATNHIAVIGCTDCGYTLQSVTEMQHINILRRAITRWIKNTTIMHKTP